MHALLVAAVLLLANPGKPPSAEEQRLYDEGTRAMASGDARAAERAFKAGYALGRDPAFLVHVGEAQEKAGAPAEAVESYHRYLREAPDASDRADIEARLVRLGPAAPASATTAPQPGEAPGEFGAAPPAPAPRAAAPVAAGVDTERPVNRDTTTDSGWNRYNTTAVISTGVTLALLGATAFFAAQAASDKDEINRLVIYRDEKTGVPLTYSTVSAKYEQAMDDGRRHDRYAKIALIAAGGSALVAAVFYVLDAKLGQEPAVAIAPDGRGLAVMGSWRWRY